MDLRKAKSELERDIVQRLKKFHIDNPELCVKYININACDTYEQDGTRQENVLIKVEVTIEVR